MKINNINKKERNELPVKSLSFPITAKSAKRQKLLQEIQEKKKIKLRSLLKHELNEPGSKSSEVKIQKKSHSKIFLFSIVVLALAAVLYQLKNVKCEFWAAYNRNLYRVVYGDVNFCFKTIDTEKIVDKLHEQIINQNFAIQLIEGSLKLANEERYIQIVFHGPTGVGKSFSADIIAENFLWQRNIQKFIYEENSDTQLTLMDVEENLSKCGFNLIIIDDLTAKEESVQYVRNFEDGLRQLAKREGYRVVLIAILKEPIDERHKNELSGFVIVDFGSFTLDNLVKCIEMHSKQLQVAITSEEMEELLKINYNNTGCKQVSKRLITQKYKK